MRIPVEQPLPEREQERAHRASLSLAGGQPSPGQPPPQSDALERLARLRSMLPAMGQELADARREAAQLRIENRKLRDQLDRMREDRRTRVADALTRLSRPSSQRSGPSSQTPRAGAST